MKNPVSTIALYKARSSENWLQYSYDFYSAGSILIAEFEKGIELMRGSVGSVPYDRQYVGQRIHMHASPRFCLAFSVELLVKAILIKQDPKKWIPETGKVKFGHSTFVLFKSHIPIDMSEDELKMLKSIEKFVAWGKYPERVNPGDIDDDRTRTLSFHPYSGWDPRQFKLVIDKIRSQLQQYYDSI